tara:strand:+ start:330 stop:668 length:339 start_codon:yes stop_codon:yes gene_type:complete
MKEFTLIFRIKSLNDFKPSPEQMQERIAWLQNIAESDKLANKGNTLLPMPGSAKTITANGNVKDGPFEATNITSGYMVVKAEHIDEAVEIAKANPIFKIGGSVEVREVLQRH